MPVTINPVAIKTVAIKTVAVAEALVAQPGPGAAAGRALGFAALITWLLDAGSGGYMLVTWVRRGGPRALIAAGDRLAPSLVFGHFGLASTGLLLWASFVVTLAPALAWVAVTLLVVVIGLGISTVTLWTPFPGQAASSADDPQARGDGQGQDPAGRSDGGALAGPAGNPLTGRLTDEVLERALTDEALLGRLVDDVIASVPAQPATGTAADRAEVKKPRLPRRQVAALIPAGHGLAAMATVLLAVLAAALTR